MGESKSEDVIKVREDVVVGRVDRWGVVRVREDVGELERIVGEVGGDERGDVGSIIG